MASAIKSTREVIIRTGADADAVSFYGTTLGFPVSCRGDTITGFDTGAITLYVERGEAHGPVFELLVADVQAEKRRLLSAGCELVEEDASVPRCYLRDPFGLTFNIGRAP